MFSIYFLFSFGFHVNGIFSKHTVLTKQIDKNKHGGMTSGYLNWSMGAKSLK